MAEQVGALSVAVTADTRAFMTQVSTQTTAAGTAAGAGFGKKMLGGLAIAGVGLGIAKIVGSSLSAAGEFQQTMNIMQAATGASSIQMESLSDLALQMGADTVFSAQEAGAAMVELAKAGLSPAEIEAGALAQALNLAATEGIALEEASTIMANAMNTFGIKAKNAVQVSDALAGASVASSASVESIALALSQVGPGAVDAGLSIQETTAALAAFADKGIKGSDAGTSLKTFLARLVPQTESAATAFKDLGLEMTDKEGNFKSLAAMSQELQDGLKGMSDAERTAALNSAFGSDARRAAIVLAEQGAAGLRKYTAETTKSGTAEAMAAARMKGYKGAVEEFSGSIETLQIVIGTVLLPVMTALIGVATQVANWFLENQEVMFTLGGIIGGFLVAAIIAYTAAMIGAAAATIAAMWPLLLVIAIVVATVFWIKWLWQNWETFRVVVTAVWQAVSKAVATAAQLIGQWMRKAAGYITGTIIPAVKKVWGYIAPAVRLWWTLFSTNLKLIWAVVKVVFKGIWGTVKAVFGFILPYLKGAWNIISTVFRTGVNIISTVFNKIRDFVNIVRSVFGALVSIIGDKMSQAWQKIMSIKDKITGFFSGAIGWLKQAGQDIIQGLIDGIDVAFDWLRDKLEGVAMVIPGWLKDVLGIGSPSKVTMEIGRQVVEGLAIGIERGHDRVAGAAQMMGGAAIPGLPSGTPRIRFDPGTVRGGDSPVEVRVFIGETELTDIVRVETRREQALAGTKYRYRRN